MTEQRISHPKLSPMARQTIIALDRVVYKSADAVIGVILAGRQECSAEYRLLIPTTLDELAKAGLVEHYMPGIRDDALQFCLPISCREYRLSDDGDTWRRENIRGLGGEATLRGH